MASAQTSMPAGSTVSLPNQSRLIPGAPALPNMMQAGSSTAREGMMSPFQGASLLGREVSGAPSTPQTQQLHTPSAPSLSMGGAKDHSLPVSPPTSSNARNIAELRAPRGTNFIPLAFAALFMLGFLGLIGFLLKDHLPESIQTLLTQEEPDAVAPTAPELPASTNPILPLVTVERAPDVPPTPPAMPITPRDRVMTESSRETGLMKTPGFDPAEKIGGNKPVIEQPMGGTPPVPVIASVTPPEKTATRTAIAQEASMPSTSASQPNQKTNTIEVNSPPEAAPAVESLKQFLAAPSLKERLKHTLGADHMQPLMERYYKHSADGPVTVDRIEFIRIDPNPELGAGRHCIFSLENKTWEFPVPVMLEEQKDGFKVDWLAFVEFKDRVLEKFLQTYQEGEPARFHVGIIRHHYFEDNVPNLDRKDAFRISPAPPNTFQGYIFLDKESPLARELRARLPWETHVWAIVELEWKKLGTQEWVELSAMPQMHWYSLPVESKPIKTTQKISGLEEMPPGISKNGKSSSKSSSSNLPPPGISKSTPDLPTTVKRPQPVGR
jgi:hypothetical protein